MNFEVTLSFTPAGCWEPGVGTIARDTWTVRVVAWELPGAPASPAMPRIAWAEGRDYLSASSAYAQLRRHEAALGATVRIDSSEEYRITEIAKSDMQAFRDAIARAVKRGAKTFRFRGRQFETRQAVYVAEMSTAQHESKE